MRDVVRSETEVTEVVEEDEVDRTSRQKTI